MLGFVAGVVYVFFGVRVGLWLDAQFECCSEIIGAWIETSWWRAAAVVSLWPLSYTVALFLCRGELERDDEHSGCC